SRQAVLTGAGQVQVWDAAAGTIAPLPGATRVPLDLGPYESKFIVVGAAAPAPRRSDTSSTP
ncbi:MAG: hypothetical protein NT090_18265, partial [Acidobacteria bacterium]|nr:hypothetical protein [Acidobacteriota bacterium]